MTHTYMACTCMACTAHLTQVDLSREARNLYRFNHNFRHARTVNFPTPYYPLVSPDVLVESFEAGRHISAFIVPGRRHPYSHRLAELGSGTMLQVGCRCTAAASQRIRFPCVLQCNLCTVSLVPRCSCVGLCTTGPRVCVGW
jgi:hypothetical protein